MSIKTYRPTTPARRQMTVSGFDGVEKHVKPEKSLVEVLKKNAGRKRHMGIRPTVRGSVMNPCDHPHGGGEGTSPVGRPGPVTPWGKPALGYKTRKTKNRTDKFIVKRRNAK